MHDDPVAAADPHVQRDFRFPEVVARPHPEFHLLRVRARRIDLGDRGLVVAADFEAGFVVDYVADMFGRRFGAIHVEALWKLHRRSGLAHGVGSTPSLP